MNDWPIESAPKGRDVLVWRPHRQRGDTPSGWVRARRVYVTNAGWRWRTIPRGACYISPTRWMRLPDPPKGGDSV